MNLFWWIVLAVSFIILVYILCPNRKGRRSGSDWIGDFFDTDGFGGMD